MKQVHAFAPVILLTLLLLTGCGNKAAQNTPPEPSQPVVGQQTSPAESDAETTLGNLPPELQKTVNDTLADLKAGNAAVPDNWDSMTGEEQQQWAIRFVLNSEWPTDRLPEGMPEYTGGKIVNSGGAEEDVLILVEGTEETIDTYLSQLEGAGYALDLANKAAKKGATTMTVTDRGNGTWQMSAVTDATTEWPRTIPAFILRPEGKTLIGEPYLDDMGSLVNLTLDVNDMSEEAGKAWLDEMAATWADSSSGSDGSGQWVGTVEHDGKSWQVVAEIYEASGGVFSVAFSWSE